MTNKKLLSLAAKAHGDLFYMRDVGAWIHVDSDGNRGAWWNPLDNDGDALGLAVKLKLNINFYSGGIEIVGDKGTADARSYEDDENKATRLAIVCAAARL